MVGVYYYQLGLMEGFKPRLHHSSVTVAKSGVVTKNYSTPSCPTHVPATDESFGDQELPPPLSP